MSEWKAIDTAPKDGTEVLVSEGRDLPMYVAYWDDEVERWIDPGMSPHADAQFENAPTHWMPLPEPPK